MISVTISAHLQNASREDIKMIADAFFRDEVISLHGLTGKVLSFREYAPDCLEVGLDPDPPKLQN
jgi:hypothetical protein